MNSGHSVLCHSLPTIEHNTGLLVSVKNAPEAKIAAALGIGILDVKDPNEGPLGRPSNAVLHEIGTLPLDERIHRSVALGELTEFSQCKDPPPDILNKFSYFKLGMSHLKGIENWPDLWSSQNDRLGNLQPVAVAYGDFHLCEAPKPQEIIRFGSQIGCRYFLLDTFTKVDSQNIFSHADEATIAMWIDHARQLEMKIVISGSIKAKDLNRCVAMRPDYIGIRGALCNEGRNSTLQKSKLKNLLRQLRQSE